MSSEHDTFIGKVKYIDYDTGHQPRGNILYPFLHKRRGFEYETLYGRLLMASGIGFRHIKPFFIKPVQEKREANVCCGAQQCTD